MTPARLLRMGPAGRGGRGGAGGKGRFRWAAFPGGRFFSCGDGLLRSPTRHNVVLYLQDDLFAHSNCLGCYFSRLVQGSVYSLGDLSAVGKL